MKRLMMIAIIMTAMLGLAGCGQLKAGSDNPTAVSIADSVTEIKVTHIIGGQETQWIAEGDELESLKEWALGLNCNSIQFEKGQSPGDMDGGEVYRFDMAEADHQGFSYVINGPDDCYLLMEGSWYSVSNPSTPL